MASSPSTTVRVPLPEQVIAGRYRLIRSLGHGGMGLVFLAEHVGVGNLVAVKFLDPEPSSDESRVARFLREAKVGLEVHHPGAAQVLDVGRDEDMRLYLVFEYIEGQDLREVLRSEGRLSFEEARSITLKVAEVLAFAHERGIIHRDIKPENIRIRRDLSGAHVKVLDFGIARLLKDGGVRLTAEGSLAGTPRYMAPEQVHDQPLDERTDLYALGLVFYEMLTGVTAFSGKNITQILMRQVKEPLPSLTWVDPALNYPEVDALLAKACAKSPRARFPSMAEFVRALQSLHVDPRAWPSPTFPPPTLPVRQAGVPLPPSVSKGLSDTVIRSPEVTEPSAPQPNWAALEKSPSGRVPAKGPGTSGAETRVGSAGRMPAAVLETAKEERPGPPVPETRVAPRPVVPETRVGSAPRLAPDVVDTVKDGSTPPAPREPLPPPVLPVHVESSPGMPALHSTLPPVPLPKRKTSVLPVVLVVMVVIVAELVALWWWRNHVG